MNNSIKISKLIKPYNKSLNIDPKSGDINPVIKLKIVDFPTPFGPNKPKIWPLFSFKFKLSSIIFLPNFNEIFKNDKEKKIELIQKN